MPSNRFLGPSDGLSIREPTDPKLKKGNIVNPPRFQNLAMGGFDSGQARGMGQNEFSIETPGSTIRDMPNQKGTNT